MTSSKVRLVLAALCCVALGFGAGYFWSMSRHVPVGESDDAEFVLEPEVTPFRYRPGIVRTNECDAFVAAARESSRLHDCWAMTDENGDSSWGATGRDETTGGLIITILGEVSLRIFIPEVGDTVRVYHVDPLGGTLCYLVDERVLGKLKFVGADAPKFVPADQESSCPDPQTTSIPPPGGPRSN